MPNPGEGLMESSFGTYCGPVDHDWQADPDRKDEGLCCARCGVTEAELEAIEHESR